MGTEFASIFASFGTKVTLIEMLPRILPIEDEEVSLELEKLLKRRGIQILTGTPPERCGEGRDGGVRMKLEGKNGPVEVEAEILLSAVGRRPVTEGVGLEALGVQLERGYVQVNPSDADRGAAYLRHRRRRQHPVARPRRLGRGHPGGRAHGRPGGQAAQLRPRALLHLLRARGGERRVDRGQGARARLRRPGGQVPLLASGKAAILGKTGGFVKVVRETRYDEVLGVHILGAHATDLIAEACVAIAGESTTEQLFRTIHAHPTLSESVMEAAHAAWGHAIHF